MAYRGEDESEAGRIAALERKVRGLERALLAPEPGWVLREVGDDLQVLYVPTGVYGPVIGSK